MINSAAESEQFAEDANPADKTYFVPAFTGLGAPCYDNNATGVFAGITRVTGKNELVRAVVDSIAYQIHDVIELMEQAAGKNLQSLQVDGGPTKNNYLMQFQSDILEKPVEVPPLAELSAQGAAYCAGISAGFYDKEIKSIRILQIDPRPFDFWSTMCNEGELLEKFNVQLSPIPLPELTETVRKAKEEGTEVKKTIDYIRANMDVMIKDSELENVAALKVAMAWLVDKYDCKAAAIQCWNALQGELGIMPCAANSLLNDMGIPVVCETDIHGAITSLLVEAAGMGETRSFFADWTIRHPDIENGELLQHCGPWPISIAKERAKLTYPLAFDHPGSLTAEAKHGDLTLCRFDGDGGEYSLLLGNAKGVEDPKGMGTYLWIEVENIKRLEAKIVEGPYIHHCVGIHKNVVPILYEACKYIGVKPDLYDPIEEDVKAYLRGE